MGALEPFFRIITRFRESVEPVLLGLNMPFEFRLSISRGLCPFLEETAQREEYGKSESECPNVPFFRLVSQLFSLAAQGIYLRYYSRGSCIVIVFGQGFSAGRTLSLKV